MKNLFIYIIRKSIKITNKLLNFLKKIEKQVCKLYYNDDISCKDEVEGGNGMANIFDVAKFILKQQGSMSTMKLQKLCYYSQAWSLVWDGDELFPEEFEAWANGPVCRELYNKHQGKYSISEDDIKQEWLSNKELTDCQKETIEVVLGHYGDKNGQWLSTLTHMESPWKDTRIGVADGEACNRIITKEKMLMYYEAL